MKNFQSYIFELNKKFEFRVKLANINPKGDVMERIKKALDAFQLEGVGAVKSLPIMEHREFPQSGPCECWQFDVTLAYPTNAVQLRQLIKERAQLDPYAVSVRNLNEAEYTDEAEAAGKDHTGSLLAQENLGGSTEGQALVGQSRIGSMMKELASRKQPFDQASNEAGKTTNELPQGDVSTVGTHQNKIPSPSKG